VADDRFERDYGCTEDDWRRWLPGAVREQPLRGGDGCAEVDIGSGRLHLRWTPMPPRRIALIAMPVLHVDFHFDGVDAPARQHFMRYFDLYMQRGGG
jgi:hypothetical protein